MPKQRIPTWLVLILVPLALVLVIPALWVFVSVTATPVHPNPESVPTVMQSKPLPKWDAAVQHGRRLVRASVAGQNLPGLSVAVGIDGDIAWAEGFGYADLKSSLPGTPQHRFRIGTASTALTSAAAGLLLEQGRLKLDDEIQTWEPAFPRQQQSVTLRQLMGNASGVTPGDSGQAPLFTKHCKRPVDALKHLAQNWDVDETGPRYRDSIYDWILVSAAIEAAAHQPFLTFMREHVFDPSGMRDTVADPGSPAAEVAGEDFPLITLIRELIYDPEARRDATADSTQTLVQDQVTTYFPRFRSDPNYGMHVMRPVDLSCYAGAGGFASTPSDLVRFGMAMNNGKLLQPATVELLQTSQRLASGEKTGYGLGWELETIILAGKPTRVIGHKGNWMGGMMASLMTFPEYGVVVAVTSNIPYADTAVVGRGVAESFVEHGKIPPRK